MGRVSERVDRRRLEWSHFLRGEEEGPKEEDLYFLSGRRQRWRSGVELHYFCWDKHKVVLYVVGRAHGYICVMRVCGVCGKIREVGGVGR